MQNRAVPAFDIVERAMKTSGLLAFAQGTPKERRTRLAEFSVDTYNRMVFGLQPALVGSEVELGETPHHTKSVTPDHEPPVVEDRPLILQKTVAAVHYLARQKKMDDTTVLMDAALILGATTGGLHRLRDGNGRIARMIALALTVGWAGDGRDQNNAGLLLGEGAGLIWPVAGIQINGAIGVSMGDQFGTAHVAPNFGGVVFDRYDVPQNYGANDSMASHRAGQMVVDARPEIGDHDAWDIGRVISVAPYTVATMVRYSERAGLVDRYKIRLGNGSTALHGDRVVNGLNEENLPVFREAFTSVRREIALRAVEAFRRPESCSFRFEGKKTTLRDRMVEQFVATARTSGVQPNDYSLPVLTGKGLRPNGTFGVG